MFSVLNNVLVEIGFVEWAMRRDGFIFKAIHEHADPAKQTSKNLNRLLVRAGVKVHSAPAPARDSP